MIVHAVFRRHYSDEVCAYPVYKVFQSLDDAKKCISNGWDTQKAYQFAYQQMIVEDGFQQEDL